MAVPTRILAIPGSLRRGSHTRSLVERAVAAAPDGATVVVYDDLASLPPFNEDDEAERTPATVLALRAAIDEADAILIATPEYNGSIPGVLKNAIDWASRPHGVAELVGKPVALVSSSPSPFGGSWALADLRRILGLSGAVPIEADLSVGKVHERHDDTAIDEQLATLVADVVAAATLEVDYV